MGIISYGSLYLNSILPKLIYIHPLYSITVPINLILFGYPSINRLITKEREPGRSIISSYNSHTFSPQIHKRCMCHFSLFTSRSIPLLNFREQIIVPKNTEIYLINPYLWRYRHILRIKYISQLI